MASLPSKAKAVQFEKPGGPEVLKVNEVSVPKPDKDQVLVKVEWAGVNFIDTYFRGGLYPVEFPSGLGNEAAGTVVALGSAVSPSEYGFDVGDRVVTYTAPGAQAEYAVGLARRTSKLPEDISTRTAAAAVLQGLTALTGVTEAHPVQKGEYILVHAAAGGLGLLFCQLGRALGAHVIGTTSTEEKAAIAKANGAEHIILYGEGRPPVPEQVLKLTGGEGVHAVFDGVGKDTFEGNFDSLRRKGSLVSIGNASGAVPPFQPLKLGGKNIKLSRPRLDNYVATREEFQGYASKLWKLVSSGDLAVKVYKEYPFTAEGVRQAHEDLASRKTSGKLVIKVAA